MSRRIVSKLIRLIIGINVIVSLVLLSSCRADERQPTSGEEEQVLPPIELPEKGNPKLDSQLNQLIQAEARGETFAFAEQSGIELSGQRVRVIIESLPGRLEEAAQAAANAGAEVETSHDDLLQVMAPVNILNSLAEEASIRLIRLPMTPLSGAGDETKAD